MRAWLGERHPSTPHASLSTVLRSGIRASQVEYLDIYSVHGINRMEQLEWTLREGGCMEVLEEYRAAGKIRWIGFSTHGHADVVRAAIASKKFDTVNLHYHVRARACPRAVVFCVDGTR